MSLRSMVVILMVSTILILISTPFGISSQTGGENSLWKLPLPQAYGPEDIAFDPKSEGPYTGVVDGRILKYVNGAFVEFATTSPLRTKEECEVKGDPKFRSACGRPTGLNFDQRTGELYICDVFYGLLKVGPNGGLATQIVAGVNGQNFSFLNAVEIEESTGNLYFIDSGAIFRTVNGSSMGASQPLIPIFKGEGYEYWSIRMKTLLKSQDLWDFVELGYADPDEANKLRENKKKDSKALAIIQQAVHDNVFSRIATTTNSKQAWENPRILGSGDTSGRLLKYEAATGEATVVLEGLSGPGGMAMSRDQTFLVISEYISGKVVKYHIKGPKAHTTETLQLENLKGNPGNVKRAKPEGFWMAMNIFNEEPNQPSIPTKESFAVKFDEKGKVLGRREVSIHLPNFLSGYLEHGGRAYAGSNASDFLGVGMAFQN
ncbi:unnamed protein product [Cuscuta campestris]|uniref:Strictosidine synthase conserved region domain-containing protein n=1 Tax=Cuscuta campestris TaxID=132261 RepID=A0A484MN08_9ASTE|nr:unnamed protein product [Cuscuta campestris]